jgi:hypothetical protein
MPKLATPSQRLVQRNHPSWEVDPAVQAALGPVIAKRLAQGVLEYVQWAARSTIMIWKPDPLDENPIIIYTLIY